MSESKVLAEVAGLTNLKPHGRYLFGRYRDHPVGVWQQSATEGNQMIFQVLLASEAVEGAARAAQDKGRVEAAGLKSASIRVVPEERILMYVHMPMVRSPKAQDVKGTLDALTTLADAGGPPLGERCEQCGGPAPRVFLVNRAPAQLCDADFETLRARYGQVSSAVQAAKTDYAKALGLGILGLVMGTLLWAGILIASGYIFSLAAIAIALLIAFLVMKGAGKPNYALVGMMILFTLGAIFLGEVLWIAVEITRLGGPFDLGLALEGFLFVASVDPGAVALSFFFALLGAFMGGSYMIRTTRAATPRFEVIS